MKMSEWGAFYALGMMGAVMTMTAAGAATAPISAPVALRTLETGEWEVNARDNSVETQKLCVSDLRQLLQVQHGRVLCRSFTISDSTHAVTTTYDCAAGGNGRTDLRVETSRLVQIRSQGVAQGAPFSFSAEARRIGDCH